MIGWSHNDRFIESTFTDLMAELRLLREGVAPSAWEYKLIILPFSEQDGIDEGERWLNDEGANGWEFVSMAQRRDDRVVPDCVAVMKRRKSPGTRD